MSALAVHTATQGSGATVLELGTAPSFAHVVSVEGGQEHDGISGAEAGARSGDEYGVHDPRGRERATREGGLVIGPDGDEPGVTSDDTPASRGTDSSATPWAPPQECSSLGARRLSWRSTGPRRLTTGAGDG